MVSPPLSTPELLDLVGDIYDCAIEPARWPVVLERIAALVDGCEAAIAFHSFERPQFQLSAKWNTDPAFERSMLENFALSPIVPLALFVQVDEPFSAFRTVGEEEIKRGRWYMQTLEAHGYGDALLTLLVRSASQFVGMSVLRKQDQPVFSEFDSAVLRPLCPHVRRAVEIADALDARKLERDTLAATLELMTTSVVLTDGVGRIIHANAAARRKMEEADAILAKGGVLFARDPAGAFELGEALTHATAVSPPRERKSGCSVVLRSEVGRDLAAWVLPLDGGLRRDLGATFEARVAIFLRELGDTSPFPAELFVRRYGITPAECRLLLLLVQGTSVQEAADALGISQSTAKTHLSRLFAKTGTDSQSDLMRLAVSALAPASAP
jgi:DNA-binding CsgD family transcriptional regulator/PAS domain-containing protein